jgi:tocopherol O-methyltransferase
MASQTLNQKIQTFYDASSQLWEEVWGEHMHHGYYGENGAFPRDHYQAQINMIEKILEWGQIETQVKSIIDIGCGIGGSSVYLAKKLNTPVIGITLSQVQARRAVERSPDQAATQFLVADALYPPLKPRSFDLVWSLESAEHFPDKRQFLEACFELLKPGGCFLMATWCHRPTPRSLTNAEQEYLRLLYKAYHLPEIISIDEYAAIAHEVGFSNLETADWTEAAQPFWNAVIRSALFPRNMKKLIKTGWPVLKGALAMPLMIQGYRSGLLRFGLLKGGKK